MQTSQVITSNVNNDHAYYYKSKQEQNNIPTNGQNSTNNVEVEVEVGQTDELWQKVSSRQKRLNSEVEVVSTKRTNLGQQPSNSSPLGLSNSFEVLNNDDQMDDELPEPTVREAKPPPIFVPNVTDIRSMVSSIEKVITKDGYSYKCMNSNKVKINTVTVDAFRNLVKHLTELKIQFHTYQLKKDRAYRVVLKNMHFSNDPEEVKLAIESYGHKVRNITNLKSSKTKTPLSIFFVDLEPAVNNKEIYNIQYLLNAKVAFEPPRKVNDVVQCKKCQRYGHTKTYCWYNSRCVKCGYGHDTRDCRKPLNSPPTCVLCGGEHPSNYKGCSVYKEIKSKSFPPLRSKTKTDLSSPDETQFIANNEQFQPLPNDEVAQTDTKKSRFTSPHLSYAQATVQGNVEREENSSLTQTLTTFFNKFEKLMEQQAQQIGSLISLLTTVISKLK